MTERRETVMDKKEAQTMCMFVRLMALFCHGVAVRPVISEWRRNSKPKYIEFKRTNFAYKIIMGDLKGKGTGTNSVIYQRKNKNDIRPRELFFRIFAPSDFFQLWLWPPPLIFHGIQ